MRVALLVDDLAEAAVIGQWLAAAGVFCATYGRMNSLLCALVRESVNVVLLDCVNSDANWADFVKRVRGASIANSNSSSHYVIPSSTE
jgi:DNA-binding NtrC family response regulator